MEFEPTPIIRPHFFGPLVTFNGVSPYTCIDRNIFSECTHVHHKIVSF